MVSVDVKRQSDIERERLEPGSTIKTRIDGLKHGLIRERMSTDSKSSSSSVRHANVHNRRSQWRKYDTMDGGIYNACFETIQNQPKVRQL